MIRSDTLVIRPAPPPMCIVKSLIYIDLIFTVLAYIPIYMPVAIAAFKRLKVMCQPRRLHWSPKLDCVGRRARNAANRHKGQPAKPCRSACPQSQPGDGQWKRLFQLADELRLSEKSASQLQDLVGAAQFCDLSL